MFRYRSVKFSDTFNSNFNRFGCEPIVRARYVPTTRASLSVSDHPPVASNRLWIWGTSRRMRRRVGRHCVGALRMWSSHRRRPRPPRSSPHARPCGRQIASRLTLQDPLADQCRPSRRSQRLASLRPRLIEFLYRNAVCDAPTARLPLVDAKRNLRRRWTFRKSVHPNLRPVHDAASSIYSVE